MEQMQKVKKALFETCLEQVESQISTLEQSLDSIVDARNNETKSSVGDKYETGRAMMQLEEQKIQSQLIHSKNSRQELRTLDLNKKDIIIMGSLVETSLGVYFLSIGLGKIKVEQDLFYCISSTSPVGKLLLGKKEKEIIEFNNRKIEIFRID